MESIDPRLLLGRTRLVDAASRLTPAYRVAASYEEGLHHTHLAQPLRRT